MIDYTGQKHNKLTLDKFAKHGGKGSGVYWWAECECGNRKQVLAKRVVSGRIKSCGECIKYQRRKDLANQERREIRAGLKQEMRRAKWEGGDWQLMPADFRKIIKGECYLCGAKDGLGVVRTTTDGPYTVGNLVAECRRCRNHRGRVSLPDFLGYMVDVINHIQLTIDKPAG